MANVTLEFLAISLMDFYVTTEVASFDDFRANVTDNLTPISSSTMRGSKVIFEGLKVFERFLAFKALVGSNCVHLVCPHMEF